MTLGKLAGAAVGAALVIRVARSRHQRFMHPLGRSFAGELEDYDRKARHDVTVRLSKGVGTRGGRPDVRGLAIRVHLRGRDLDLLLSSFGQGPAGRHLPVPRRSFDTLYGSITAYRDENGDKLYLTARPDPAGPAFGRTLESITSGGRFLIVARRRGIGREVARVTLGEELSPAADEALAYDPIRNSVPGLHPTGMIHGVRAFAYRLGQRWRGATPARPNAAAVTRTLTRH
jgi:hypothetical protein